MMAGMASMSGMSGMGMDMSTGGMFLADNQMLARTYWYIVAACLVAAGLFRLITFLVVQSRSVSPRLESDVHVDFYRM